MYFVNPIIHNKATEQSIYEEGCLSFPEHFAEIDRPDKLTIEYLDEKNEKQMQVQNYELASENKRIKTEMELLKDIKKNLENTLNSKDKQIYKIHEEGDSLVENLRKKFKDPSELAQTAYTNQRGGGLAQRTKFERFRRFATFLPDPRIR